MANLLEIKGLTRRFGGVNAVNDVSFSVPDGEIFGLIGPNGAGKTTLFNLITGVTVPSSGRLFYVGQDITGLHPHQIAHRGIARTFQNIRLLGSLSALENVIIARHIHGQAGFLNSVLGLSAGRAEERATRQKALELLDLVGLADRADQIASSFPYGDQRRLEIARALALEPRLLLLDEPAAGMQSNEKTGLTTFIRDIRARFSLTILLIEHQVPLVMDVCDQIAVLNFGHLIAIGDPAHIRRDPAVIEAYLGDEETA